MLNRINFARGLAAAALCLLLGACLLSPGKFTAQLDLRRNGQFSYAYTGEIYLLGLSKLAQMGRATDKPFAAEPCYLDGDDTVRRECTAKELADQKRDWEESRKANADNKKRDNEMMRAMLGGIDPADPRAAEELAARLRRQAGWRSVEYKGDGLFLVDFQLSTRLDHDFAFPTIERLPLANSFVIVNRRADGTLRIDAPGFGPGDNGDPLRNMMKLAAMAPDKKDEMPQIPALDGKFTVLTDGEILANNTDAGPQNDPAGKRLDWIITPRSGAAPTALIRTGG